MPKRRGDAGFSPLSSVKLLIVNLHIFSCLSYLWCPDVFAFHNTRAFEAAAHACASAGQWSVIQVLISEAAATCTNARDAPGVSPTTAWEMRRALLAGLAAAGAGAWTKALDELRDMYGSTVRVDGRDVVFDEDDDLDAGREGGKAETSAEGRPRSAEQEQQGSSREPSWQVSDSKS